ncbi:MAG TPA: hypothetical protein VK892_19520 [Pyrinomonadaceae bacterium]|nr:hypothetical protein [Pyrinomonadaceae bacterium]
MTDKKKEEKVDHTKENLEAVGQMILGELEMIAGTITADGITRAEGEFNVEAGSLHQEANKNLTAIDEEEEAENEEE